MLKQIHHIAIAVHSIEQELPWYRDTLRLPLVEIEEVESQKVRVALFKIGESYLELLEPLSSESSVAKFLAKKGPGLHHISYEVEDIENTLQHLKQHSISLIDESPRPGAHGMQIAFIHPKSSGGVLTELCSSKD